MATCPDCDFDEIETEDYEEGDTLSCPECGKNLVLAGADQLNVVDDDDDLDDDDDEDEDEDEDKDDDKDDDDDEDDDTEEVDE